MWTTVHAAMEKQDYATAEQVSGKMLAQRSALVDAVDGTPIEHLAGMGFDQLDSFHKALADQQGEKAQSLMAGIDQMGQATMKILNPEE